MRIPPRAPRRPPLLAHLGWGALLLAGISCSRPRNSTPDSAKAIARPDSAASAPPGAQLTRVPTGGPTDPYPFDDISWVDSLTDKRIGVDPVVRSDTLAPGVICYTLARYLVIQKPAPHDDVGSDVIVRPRTPAAACGADSIAGDFVRRNEEAEYFLAMRGDRLFLDSGTGNLRAVLIYDVPAAKKTTEFTGEIAGWRDSTTLLAWIAGGDSLAHARCPKVPEGLGVVADSLVAIDLRTNAHVPLNRWRCDARE
jgi:hypothetical protein